MKGAQTWNSPVGIGRLFMIVVSACGGFIGGTGL
jgi:hypothetical protein